MTFLSDLKIAKHFYDTEREGPVCVDIHPTLACQLKCYFCISSVEHISGIPHANFSRSKRLDWPVLKRAINDMKDMSVRSVQLTGGGEPTTYPEFSELLKELWPMKVGLITNGILVGEYAKEVVEACDWVRVSLDAVGSEMYKQIKGADHYAEVMDGINKLVETRGEREKPRIGVAYIITPESVGGITDVAMELKDSGIDYLQYKPVVMKGMSFTPTYQARIRKAIDSIRDIGPKVLYTQHGGIDDQGETKNIPICEATNYVAVIGADGEVYACCALEYLPHASYGSIYQRSFRDIWNDRPLVQVSENLCFNCRYRAVSETVHRLKSIQDGEFL